MEDVAGHGVRLEGGGWGEKRTTRMRTRKTVSGWRSAQEDRDTELYPHLIAELLAMMYGAQRAIDIDAELNGITVSLFLSFLCHHFAVNATYHSTYCTYSGVASHGIASHE